MDYFKNIVALQKVVKHQIDFVCHKGQVFFEISLIRRISRKLWGVQFHPQASKGMKNKNENGVVDEISELPADVLVAIISRLTWREAVVTSILSTRWRHLYTYITRLSYTTRHSSEQSKDKYVQQLQEKEFPKHMKEIYDFLASNRGCRFLEEFRVHIPCLKGTNIHRWLPLVLEKEVESIDIRMIYHAKAMPGYYNFPRRTLIKRKGGGLGSFGASNHLGNCLCTPFTWTSEMLRFSFQIVMLSNTCPSWVLTG